MTITTKKSGYQIPKSQGEIVTRSQIFPVNIVGSTIQGSGNQPHTKTNLPTSSATGKNSNSKPSIINTKKAKRESIYPNVPIKSKNACEFFIEATREGQLCFNNFECDNYLNRLVKRDRCKSERSKTNSNRDSKGIENSMEIFAEG